MKVDALVLVELGGVLLGLALLARVGRRVRMSAVPFYLLAGFAFGEGGLLPLDTSRDFVELGGDIGLVLLLFMLGLEYSARELIDGVRASPIPGLVDLANAIPGVVAALLLGWGYVPAFILGGATYITSSGIVAKTLRDLGKERSAGGRLAVSLLVIEDLVMVVMMPVAGALVLGGTDTAAFGWTFLSVGCVGLVLALAVRIERPISRLLHGPSDEAVLLAVLGFALLVAGAAESLRVSAAVGALLAGILMSGPLASHARTALAPLRDLFAALFFFLQGLSVSPGSLVPLLWVAGLLAAAGALSKVCTTAWSARRAKLDIREGWRTAITMIPRGEFSVALAVLGAGIEPRLVPLVAAYVVGLAVITPILYRITETSSDTPLPRMAPD